MVRLAMCPTCCRKKNVQYHVAREGLSRDWNAAKLSSVLGADTQPCLKSEPRAVNEAMYSKDSSVPLGLSRTTSDAQIW